ncbi:hypothetical protein DKT74_14225 [Streptomyces sp. ZEA17I]|uniref:hypothetical protein n=1 Tax=Streptomyces sp. ZEA17I TaxID=2202516 RepID=UPI000D6ED524|nr:hypothetical protein [Streptomyces sp. ZEA17I]PWS43893.1 hypothetical protein DKT74_14225 [Streptomyces sp. ZEA17I]
MTDQLKATDVVGMTPWQMDEARREGRLDDLEAQLSAPPTHALPYKVPTDPETGRPVPQLGAAAVKVMSAAEIDAAAKAGKLTAYMAGHEVVPPPPDASAPAPERASWQFTADHVALMDTDEVARFRAQGMLADYDQAQAAGGAE